MNRWNFLQACAALSAAAALPSVVRAADPFMRRFGDGRDWFFEKLFGMFIHWGLYAIPGWHEQHQWRKRVPREEYVKLAKQWNPADIDFTQDASARQGP